MSKESADQPSRRRDTAAPTWGLDQAGLSAVYYYIERMDDHDIERVQAIERQSFSTGWSAKTYREELRKPDRSRYIVARTSATAPPPRAERVAERRGVLAGLLPGLFGAATPPADMIVGYAGLALNVDEGHVMTIAVDPRFRGRSVGELLLSNLIDQAIDVNATWMTLEVRKSNETAQKLYLKYGFRATDIRPRYYTDNGEDALIMWTDPIQSPAYQARLRELRQKLFDRLQRQAQARDQVSR